MDILIYVAVGVIAVGALAYWWMRPVTWQDGEGTIEDPRNPYLNTDSDLGGLLDYRYSLRGWWENERRRWHR